MANLDSAFEYQTIRSEIQAEHSLMSNRLNWYVTAQSFLIIAFAISEATGFTWFRWLPRVLIPILGLVCSALIYPSIAGASITIKLWHERQKLFLENHPEFQKSFELRRTPLVHEASLLFPRLVPLVFALFWAIILLASRLL